MTSPRPSNRGVLAWSVFGLAVVLCLAGLVLAFTVFPEGPGAEEVIDVVGFLAYPLVGALLVSRRGNPLGWLFCAVGLVVVISYLTSSYAHYGLFVEPGSLPGALPMYLWQSASFLLGLALPVIFLPLYFPDGRLPSPRWRPVALTAAILLALNVLSILLLPGPIDEDHPSVKNPFGVEAAGGVIGFLTGATTVLLLVLALVSIVSLIVRGFRARGEVRRQFGLLAVGVAVLLVAFLLDSVLQGVVPGWGPLSALIALSAIPIATYFALVKRTMAVRQPATIQ